MAESPLATASVVLAIVGYSLNRAGVSAAEIGTYGSYLALVILWPGALLWRVSYRWRRDGLLRTSYVPDLEDLACGFACGYVVELAAYVVARGVGMPRAYVTVPILVGLGLSGLIVRERRRQTFQASTERDDGGAVSMGAVGRWAVGAILSFEAVWFTQRLFSTHPLNAVRITDPDEMFHRALVGDLRHHFPATYPYVEYPGDLTYQWFVHAHMAASSWATGIDVELLYRRFDPLTLTVVATLGVALLATRVAQTRVAAPLAVALLVLVGSFDITGTVIGEAATEDRFFYGLMLMHSPTQAFAYAISVPVILMVIDLLRCPLRWRPPWIVWTVLVTAIAGAKVAFLPLYVCGLLAAAVVAAISGDARWRRALVAAGLTIAVVVTSSWLLYRGDSQSLQWAPLQTADFFMARLGTGGGGTFGRAVFAVALLAMWTLPGVGAIALLVRRETRGDPSVWFLLAGAASGYGATFLLGHGGNSQLFFGRAGVPLLTIASAWGMSLLVQRASSRQRWAMLVAALTAGVMLLAVRAITEGMRTVSPVDGRMVESPALRVWVNLPTLLAIATLLFAVHVLVRDLTRGRVALSLGVALAFLLGLGLARSMAFLIGHGELEGKPYRYAYFGPDGRASATWLRDNSSADERVMTNAHCGPVRRNDVIPCDGRHFWMSALSERRFVIEGWAYTARSDSDWAAPYWGDPSLLRRNDRLLRQPTAAALKRFTERHDVGWIFLDLREPAAYEALLDIPGVSLGFRRGDYAVLRVGIP